MSTALDYQPSDEQDRVVRWLERVGTELGVEMDVDAVDEPAHEPCGNDSDHGWGTVYLPQEEEHPLCATCVPSVLYWYRGETVSLEVVRETPE